MGDRLTEEKKSRQTSPTPYGDIFDKLCPTYMSMGMTYAEYWDGEVGMKTFYRNAYKERVENEYRIADRNNWYMGQYMMAVLQAVPLLVAGLNVKPSTHLPEYPDKPFFDTFDEKKKEEDRRKAEEDQMKLAMAVFQAATAQFNKNIQSRQENSNQSSGQ